MRGYAGYEKIAGKYRILDIPSWDREEQETKQRWLGTVTFLGDFRELLAHEKPGATARIYRMLLFCPISHPLIDRLSELTERTVNSEIDWKEYVRLAREIFEELSNVYYPRAKAAEYERYLPEGYRWQK